MVKNIKNKYGLRNSNLRKKINEKYSSDYYDGELELRVNINRYYHCPDINDNYYLTELCMDILQDSGIIQELAMGEVSRRFDWDADAPNFDVDRLLDDKKFQQDFFREFFNRVKDLADKIEDNSLYPSFLDGNED